MSEAALSSPSYQQGASVTRAAAGDSGPVTPVERIHLLDVLRGFALFGILQVNWLDYKQVFGFLIDGSFYTMYSFLFGLGFAIQLIRAQEKKRPFALRYLWRTILLFAIGSAHFVFVWGGDIVRHYGLLAIVLLLVYRWRLSVILGLAAGMLILSMAGSARLVPRGESLWRRPNPEQAFEQSLAVQLRNDRGAANSALRFQGELDGDYWNSVRGRGRQLATELRNRDWRWLWGNDILGMFLLGLFVGRRRILHEPQKHVRLLWTVVGVGLVLGVVGNAFDNYGNELEAMKITLPAWIANSGAAYTVGNVGLCLFYMATITLLFTRWERVRRFLAPLSFVGRMGLTNYIAQSVALTILLLPIGFSLAEKVPGRPGFLILDAFFAVQVLYSGWWFRHFAFGPVEWVWRSLTWWRLQPMRVNAVSSELVKVEG